VGGKKRLLLNPRVDYKNLNVFASFLNNPIGLIDPLGLGTWHVDFPNNGTPQAVVDVYYVFSKGELGCCTAATVDRYLDRTLGWSLDQDSGGTWDAVNQTAHAELDAPQGIGIRWPFGIFSGIYDLPQGFHFQWKVRCTKGSDKIFSTYEETITVSGHAEGSAYTYTLGDYPDDPID
jgi:hypothetical protein